MKEVVSLEKRLPYFTYFHFRSVCSALGQVFSFHKMTLRTLNEGEKRGCRAVSPDEQCSPSTCFLLLSAAPVPLSAFARPPQPLQLLPSLYNRKKLVDIIAKFLESSYYLPVTSTRAIN